MALQSNSSTKRKQTDTDEDKYTSPIETPPYKRKKNDMGSSSKSIPFRTTMAESVKTKERTPKKQSAAAQDTAPVDNAPIQFNQSRPWLTRTQKLSEQNLWLLHFRDNLVPGATGPKSGEEVTKAFNDKFKHETKKNLVWKTLQKRISTSRKQFNIDNPEYEAAVKYPPDLFDGEEDVEQDEVDMVEEKDGLDEPTRVSSVAPRDIIQPSAPLQKHVARTLPVSPPPSPNKKRAKAQIASLDLRTVATDLSTTHPGAPPISAISTTHVSPFDRANYHLRHRSDNIIAFRFLDAEEDDDLIAREDYQFVDHALLLKESPVYARFAQSNPNSPFPVPKQFGAKTVNAFTQIVSPVRAKHLPTHYLWKSGQPVLSEYDRFGGVLAEKIHWSIDAMLQLQDFARQMQVLWICDMVTDRLHWMFLEQSKMREMCLRLSQSMKGTRMPSAPNREMYAIVADDFTDEALDEMVHDGPMLAFVAELMCALGGAPDEKWLDAQEPDVQVMFERAAGRGRLVGASRQDFCLRYHHHSFPTPCYTHSVEPAISQLVQTLYDTEDMLALSTHVSLETELKSVVHAASGSSKTLKELNTSPEMLEAEKMILEMEMRLKEAKDAAARAREADAVDKERETMQAKDMAMSMFARSDVVEE